MLSTKYSQNNPTFGMALYMPSKSKITKLAGSKFAEEIYKVRPELEKVAQDKDIFVSLENHKKKNFDNFRFTVSVLNGVFKNPIKRFLAKHNFSKIFYAKEISSAYTIKHGIEPTMLKSWTHELLGTTTKAIEVLEKRTRKLVNY